MMRRLIFAALLLAGADLAQAGGYATTEGFPNAITPRGPKGDRGCAILPTQGAPDNALGADCDFAFDAGAAKIYGPKIAGQWGAGVTLSPVVAAQALVDRAQLDRMAAEAARDAADAAQTSAAASETAAAASAASAAASASSASAILAATARTDLPNTWGPAQTFSAPPVLPMTTGSIPFIGAGGVLSQDNSALYYDPANRRLGIGTPTPASAIHYRNLGFAPPINNPNAGWGAAVGNGAQYIEIVKTGTAPAYGGASLIHYHTTGATGPGADVAAAIWSQATNLGADARFFAFWPAANTPSYWQGHTWTGPSSVVTDEHNCGNEWGNLGLQTDIGSGLAVSCMQIVPDGGPSRAGAAYAPVQGITIASPAVVTIPGHRLDVGNALTLNTALGGTLPTPFVANAVYHVVEVIDGNNVKLSTTPGGAAIATTGGAFSGSVRAAVHYAATAGIVFSRSIHGHRFWIGRLDRPDTYMPNGVAHYSWGGSSAASAPNAWAYLNGHWTTALDATAATFPNWAMKFGVSHKIAFGTAFVGGSSVAGGLHIATAGAATGRLLSAGSRTALSWSDTGAASKLGLYGATPVVQPTGYGTVVGAAKIANFDAGTATLAQTAGQLAALIADLKSLGAVGD